jgi:hypothetical protein
MSAIDQQINYLTFTSPIAFSIAARANDTPGINYSISSNRIMEYSTDTLTWNSWDGQPISVSAGKNVYIRGTITADGDFDIYTNFVFPIGSKISCSGDIRSLDDYNDPKNVVLKKCCYYEMFSNCRSLIKAPELPATILADYCYYSMFEYCTSLRQLPLLSATTLATMCYFMMFSDCSSLKISQTKTETYKNSWKINADETGALFWNKNMFQYTGGTFTNDPLTNTIYYYSLT